LIQPRRSGKVGDGDGDVVQATDHSKLRCFALYGGGGLGRPEPFAKL
jgi:hypothetical protein